MLLTFSTPQFTCTVGRRVCIQLVVCLSVCLSSFPFPLLSLLLSLSICVCISALLFSPVLPFAAPLFLLFVELILLSSCLCCTSSIEFCGCRYCCCLISLGSLVAYTSTFSESTIFAFNLFAPKRKKFVAYRSGKVFVMCVCVWVCAVYMGLHHLTVLIILRLSASVLAGNWRHLVASLKMP